MNENSFTLLDCLKASKHLASQNKDRYNLYSIFFDFKNDSIVSTDGVMMSIIKYKFSKKEKNLENFNLSFDFYNNLISHLQAGYSLMEFLNKNPQARSSINFPDYLAIIPRDIKTSLNYQTFNIKYIDIMAKIYKQLKIQNITFTFNGLNSPCVASDENQDVEIFLMPLLSKY